MEAYPFSTGYGTHPLGFRDRVRVTAQDSDEATTLLADMIALNKFFSNLRNLKLEVTVFSDSIVISLEDTGESIDYFLALSDLVFALFRDLSVLVRGAVTSGPLFHQGSVVLGPALVKAYELETQLAIYPRVIIDPDWDFKLGEQDKFFRALAAGEDGLLFVNYFSRRRLEFYKPAASAPDQDFHEMIRKAQTSAPLSHDLRVQAKYRWLHRYADTQPPLTQRQKQQIKRFVVKLTKKFAKRLETDGLLKRDLV